MLSVERPSDDLRIGNGTSGQVDSTLAVDFEHRKKRDRMSMWTLDCGCLVRGLIPACFEMYLGREQRFSVLS
jgi:hypothetical protein